jgi:hypothetical protein
MSYEPLDSHDPALEAVWPPVSSTPDQIDDVLKIKRALVRVVDEVTPQAKPRLLTEAEGRFTVPSGWPEPDPEHLLPSGWVTLDFAAVGALLVGTPDGSAAITAIICFTITGLPVFIPIATWHEQHDRRSRPLAAVICGPAGRTPPRLVAGSCYVICDTGEVGLSERDRANPLQYSDARVAASAARWAAHRLASLAQP